MTNDHITNEPTPNDATHVSNDDEGPTRRLFANRREFLQATSALGAGLAGLGGMASAQSDEVIELEAVNVDGVSGRGRAEYVWEDGEVRGPPPNACDYGDGSHVWLGVAPDEVDGQTNPTLELTAGQTYTVEWTNLTGDDHSFVVVDDDGEELVSTETVAEQDATQTVEFAATEEMAEYYCASHTGTQRGEIDVGDEDGGPAPEPSDDAISVLFLGGPSGGSHDAPARAVQIIPYLLNRGIEVLYTDRKADLEADTLHRYDAWILYDNRSDLSQAQEDSVIEFVEDGGGFVALHSASACFTGSDRFISHLGGQFDTHGEGEMTTTHEQPDHPVLSHVDPIESWDETYRHTNLNPDNEVLAYGDFPDYGADEEPEPWTWVREEGDGRVFYTAWGHDDRTWSETGFKKLVENAIRWTSGNEDTIAADTRVLDELEFDEADVPYYPAGEDDTVPEEVGEGMQWERIQHALSPAESRKRIVTPEEFELTPYAHEEMYPDGVEGNVLDLDFDAQGRCWIALTKDYPNDLGQNRDEIVVCEDTDGDGRADEFTTFADGLSVPASLTVVEDGVLVANLGGMPDGDASSGSMLYLEDADGDDRVDDVTELFSGFGNGDTHAGPNSLVYGFDNWVWGQVGYSGFSGTVGGQDHEFSSAVYRFRPDGSELEVVAGLPGNQAGLEFNEEGLAFASAATTGQPSNYVAIPERYYDLVEGFSAPDLGTIADSNRFLPITDRVRQVDWHGGFTAATGHTVYTAREYPEKYWNRTAFVGDGTGHLLGTFYLEQDGASYSAHYPHNFAASTDEWFSPTYSKVGPDGSLWFIDWYNYVFQHNPTPEGYETGDGNAYVTDLRDHAFARLYRATYDGGSGQSRDLGDADPDELVDALTDDNMFWRRTAQRNLVERGETAVVSDLVDLVTNESTDSLGLDPSAVHALWTLDGLGALDEGAADDAALQAARGALTHSAAGVRLTALRVLPPTAATRDAVLSNDLLNDDDGRVQMWALLALAETPTADAAGEAVYQMISQEANYSDSVLVDAASSAGARHADGFVAAYEANEDTSGGGQPDDVPNLLSNAGFESGSSGSPTGWETNVWGGSAEFSHSAENVRTGDHGAQITSENGADAAWYQTVDVEANAEYTFTAYVKTGPNFGPDDGYGVTINVHELGQDSLATVVEEPNTDWTKLETTINTGNNEQIQCNCLFGGWGNASGTVWFDDAELVQTGGFGDALQTVYDRVTTHVEQSDGSDDGGDGGPDAIEPGTTIELDGYTEGWEGVAPAAVEGTTNPTLTLREGAEYTVTFINQDGVPHDFVLQDDANGEITGTDLISESGATASLTFTASAEMVRYICTVHPGTMVGDVEVVASGN